MLNEKVLREIALYEKEYNKTLNKDVIERVLEEFEDAGHSGFSASYVLNYIKWMIEDENKIRKVLEKTLVDIFDADEYRLQKCICDNIITVYDLMKPLTKEDKKVVLKLLNQKPLTPIYGTDDEWTDVSTLYGEDTILGYNIVAEYQNNRDSSIFKTVFNNGLEIATIIDDQLYSEDGGLTHFTTGMFGRKQITFPYVEKESEEVVYLFYPTKESRTPYILTDQNTIDKLREISEAGIN